MGVVVLIISISISVFFCVSLIKKIQVDEAFFYKNIFSRKTSDLGKVNVERIRKMRLYLLGFVLFSAIFIVMLTRIT